MIGLTNTMASSIGGNEIKITDYLDNPIEITNITAQQLYQYECVFGDFILKNHGCFGYGKLGQYSLDYPEFGNYEFIIYNNNTSNYYNNIITIPTLAIVNGGIGTFNHVYQGLLNNGGNVSGSTLIKYPTSSNIGFKGKIWVGNFKQIIQT